MAPHITHNLFSGKQNTGMPHEIAEKAKLLRRKANENTVTKTGAALYDLARAGYV
jgi:hypothetical protein